ncbi:hypothetical protein N7463_004843 [Penicillium fimorum]|uniref:Nephrocystin 3-like N-terminal domain-containing protein n=1 Tax=Penicillium fimorum TaxID=1882269 RepID=A0A9W9XRF7_9EURO|nr:hypothetical protein N7463_004843 [Penicillium fimorum]
MSGLEALSLACNVMTIITFALDTAKVYRSIYETGSLDENLKQDTEYINRIFDNVELLLLRQPTQPTEAEFHLRILATNCMKYTEAIRKELVDTSPKNSTKRAAVKATAKSVLRKSHIDKLQRDLDVARKTLDSALIAQILDESMKSSALNRVTYDTLDQQQKDFLAHYKQIEDLFADFNKSKETQAYYERLLDSLKYQKMNDRKTSITQRHKNTFEWIFKDEGACADSAATCPGDNTGETTTPENKNTDSPSVRSQHKQVTKQPSRDVSLLRWLTEDCRCLYWVSGKPGSGKSTFMKFIENDRRTQEALRSWHPQCNIISHFLWKPGTEDQRSFKGLLCSLLEQVLSKERTVAIQLLSEIPTLNRKRDVTDWDINEVMELLFRVFRCSSCTYLVLLDGLDEIAEPHGGMKKIFDLLDNFVAMSQVKLCVSSRLERLFADKFGLNPAIRMQDLTHKDIRSYTTDFLGDLQLDPGGKLHEKILDQISQRAEGVFIWVYVVLQNVKTGIEQWNETWDDIYDRITMLPPDLMKLYKDMWSRLDDHNEKYIKKAARYFQHTRERNHSYIASLALVADDQMLEAFTRPNEVPCLGEFIKMCELTSKTLLPVSVGLLEVYCPSTNPALAPDFTGNRAKVYWWSERMCVRFIHRTAIDFLDSDEGKKLFERHTLGPGDFLSSCVKVELALRSICHYRDPPLVGVWYIMAETFYQLASMKGLAQVYNGLLSTIHQCALNKSRALIRPPYGISYENFFLFEACTYGFYEYVEEWLRSFDDSRFIASTYALIGACNYDVPYPRPSKFNQRYHMIRDILKKYLQSDMGVLEPSAVRDGSENIMLVWRCFLLREAGRQNFVEREEEWMLVEILELFIKAGVMAESPGPRYLVAVQNSNLKIVQRLTDEQLELGHGSLRSHRPCSDASTIYAELNDAFLLQQVSGKMSGTSELISIHATDAFMRPVLVDNGMKCRKRANFFYITVNEDGLEASKEWIFRRCISSQGDLLPDSKLDFLQAVDLGMFPHAVDALDNIGYHLSAVNKAWLYDCLPRC